MKVQMNVQELKETLYRKIKIEGNVTYTSVERFEKLDLTELALFGYQPAEIEDIFGGSEPFYKVQVTISVTPSSRFDVVVCLPEEGWNGRLVGIGNGGSAQMLLPASWFAPLTEKFAVMHLTLGPAPDTNRGVHKPAVWADFGWRATHLATVFAKKVLETVFGEGPKHSYFMGTSTGGQQAVQSAERFSEDYDGIYASAPGISRTYLHIYFLHINKYFMVDNKSAAFTYDECMRITGIVRAHYEKDGDGVPGDRWISDPYRLDAGQRAEIFEDIKANAGLSKDQLFRLSKLYEGPVNHRTGEVIFPGIAMGAETALFGMICPLATEKEPLYVAEEDAFKDMLFYPMSWAMGKTSSEFSNWRDFDYDKDTDRMEVLKEDCNADTADLSEFKARGGKMIMTSGACDIFVPHYNVSDYYDRVVEKNGLEETQQFFRYYVIPGTGHAMPALIFEQDGVIYIGSVEEKEPPKADAVFSYMFGCGVIRLLVDWVENGKAPDVILASGWNESRPLTNFPVLSSGICVQRPVFPYPDAAEYVGGDPMDIRSFRRKKGEVGKGVRRAERYY